MPKSKSSNRPDARTLGELFTEMMDAYKLKDKVYEIKLTGLWKEILGPPVAKFTRKIFFSGDRMTVELNSSVLRNELYLAKAKILSSLNERLGGNYIKELVLK